MNHQTSNNFDFVTAHVAQELENYCNSMTDEDKDTKSDRHTGG